MSTEPIRMSAPERREVILDAAREVFARSGFSGARVRAIAARAGINEAMIYRHFESKGELFAAAVAQPIEDAVNHILVTPFPPLPPSAGTEHMRQRTVTFFRDLLTALREVGPLLGVVLFADQESGTRYYRQWIEPAFDRLVQLTNDTLRQWAHRDFDADLVQRTVFGMCWAISLDEHFGSGAAPDLDRVADQLTGILFDGIAAR
jgi:TetR/AcrR family transcriptional regulator